MIQQTPQKLVILYLQAKLILYPGGKGNGIRVLGIYQNVLMTTIEKAVIRAKKT